EVPELDQLGLGRVLPSQGDEGVVQVEQVVRPPVRVGRGVVQRDPAAAAAVPLATLSAGGLDADAAPGPGRRAEEVATAVPRPARVGSDQSEVRLVDQGGSLEGLARPLAGEVPGGESAELVVDQREQFGGGPGVPGRGRVDQAGDVGHPLECKRPGPGQQLPTENCPPGNGDCRPDTPGSSGTRVHHPGLGPQAQQVGNSPPPRARWYAGRAAKTAVGALPHEVSGPDRFTLRLPEAVGGRLTFNAGSRPRRSRSRPGSGKSLERTVYQMVISLSGGTAMRSGIAVVFLMVVGRPLVAADYPAPVDGYVTLGEFPFASGETLPEVRIHYRTLGSPRRDERGVVGNAVLVLHGTGGEGGNLVRNGGAGDLFAAELFGAGQPLDATRYFIIVPDNFGHGRS